MTTIAIREKGLSEHAFEAFADNHSAGGRTAGEALDALLKTAGLTAPAAIIIARNGTDLFFSQAQHDRMKTLLDRRATLMPGERIELESLVDAEIAATVARTDSLVRPSS